LYWRTKEIDNPLLVVPFQEISNGEHHEGKKISTANEKNSLRRAVCWKTENIIKMSFPKIYQS
jgi:hypothetical protein